MSAYYNEIDPYAAQWLRNLITAGHIAPGDVDERSIEDVRPDDLRGYTQCHFFAGIGVWSLALRRAGWSDDRPVWTGSCPCPPFSAAGKGSECPSCGGKSCLSHPVVTAGWICLDCGDEWRGDDRHLLPEFIRLKGQCRPANVFGEQVASRDGRLWLYTLRAVMEEAGYAVGAADLCAAGVGAPHIRQRLWFVEERLAYADGRERQRLTDGEGRLIDGTAARRFEGYSEPAACGVYGDVEHTEHDGQRQHRDRLGETARTGEGEAGERQRFRADPADGDATGGLADAASRSISDERKQSSGQFGPQPQDGSDGRAADRGSWAGPAGRLERPGPTNGHWRDADWLFCRDGKWRPVEPRPQQMVDGSAPSLGRVRPGHVEEIELEIGEWSIRHQANAGEALHDLRQSLSARAQREWPAGGLPGLHEAPFLLAFLRQLTEQRWAFSERLSGESPETAEARLRVLRDAETASCAPCERGLDGQQTGECADALRVLSSILARHAQEAWGLAYEPYAAAGFPLEHGARARVGRLRAYGNAIVADAAQVFIEAYLDAERDRFRLTELSLPSRDEGVFG